MLNNFQEIVLKSEPNLMKPQEATAIFICIEGLDGSGKTTQAKRLVRNLRRKGFDAVYTTEPSTGKVGRLIQRFVLNRKKRGSIALEALLFAADRVDHVEAEVKPLLKRGKVVICDRYVYSTLAYQDAAQLDPNWIDCINQFALKPDLALFIDVPVNVVVKRFKKKRTVMENRRNMEDVRKLYLELVQEQRLTLVDGDKPVDDVMKDILEKVLAVLSR